MHDHPRVSVVLIGFNQEAFIEEAVAAILAQDYPNLQIVLSDDNSSDQTFALMQRARDAYDGPHAVVLNRTEGGKGVLQHMYHALERCDGVLMVGTAGDDISAPDRVSKLVAAWRGTGAAGVYSAWNRVDVEGRFLVREGIEQQNDRDLAAYFSDRTIDVAFGCTAAYDIAFMRSLAVPSRPIWSEDYFLSLVAMLQGRDILYVNEPLVAYRQNPKAMRNFVPTAMDHLAYEQRDSRFFAGLADLLQAFLAIVDTTAAGTRIDRQAIVDDIAWYQFRAGWAQRSLRERIGYAAGLRSWERIRWATPRLIGLPTFIRVKITAASLRHAS